ncbi:MAG: hypothetical protein J0H43_09570, partial [Actinobacteria bacterium]|nr:hypothetical protein [Actinomycetota bacterium]
MKYCFSSGYFASRTFTEQGFSDAPRSPSSDNTPLDQVLAPNASNNFVKDLNRFWTAAAKLVHKTFTPVQIAEAPHPKCDSASSASEFGYCSDDNTVYYSLPGVEADPDNGNVTLVSNQAADFALGTLFSIGWGMAVRHQLFDRSVTDGAGLLAAACYTGSYAKDINVTQPTHGQLIPLSPSDLDEGTSAML